MSANWWQSEFELDGDLAYLNHAGVAPWPRRTRDAVVAFAEENLHRGASGYPRWIEREGALRESLRRLINACCVDEIALLKNTSEVLSVVAHGLSWQP
ncbi:MAG TPA: aminotransferase, partial [Pseudomonadales bacterium]|nr:aminotransferase [Pseudomonadales bacterium]